MSTTRVHDVETLIEQLDTVRACTLPHRFDHRLWVARQTLIDLARAVAALPDPNVGINGCPVCQGHGMIPTPADTPTGLAWATCVCDGYGRRFNLFPPTGTVAA